MSPGINLVPKADLNSDSDTVASPRPRAENEPRGQNELSRKQKVNKTSRIIDEEDPIPHDLADSDDEDLVNLDIDDGVNVVYSSEEED
ncbi:hypothetical protein Tco_0752589 [Tanacetum coccineum]|uniref:Uncharacterized protein n=1 Tax=Tanacetum coccineum TaxID=301880 RepID=A0ABQ4ZB08_9ASTR